MANPTRPPLPALTSVRFFAACHILLFHSWAMKALTRAPAWFQKFASVGYVAVSFFFVLSGFILIYTYAGKPLHVCRFWRARLARLYPMYLVSLALSAPFFFYGVLRMHIPYLWYFQTHMTSTVVLVLMMLQAWVPMAALGWNGPAWAVSVEIFFYILFPLLLGRFERISDRGLAVIALAGWMLAVVTAITYVVLRPDHVDANSSTDFLFWLSALKFFPLMRLPEFMVGLACGFWFLRGRHSPAVATPLVLGGTGVALSITAFSHLIPYPIMHTGLYAPAFAAIIWGLALRPEWSSFLEWRWLLLLGESSYCLYLLHVIILGMFLFSNPTRITTTSLSTWFCGAVAAIGVAVLAFRFVEEPARKWLRGRPAAVPSSAREAE